ncbi:Wadjet anti-phage system protein JetD domain-containing protein [Cupriavidus sp. TMH.W2]|uniref:Wadjet anti-phage system protein JetD domain-containing protein n=1 Tax=Cupriavidus sp. TMH.W2 TaxID=3434465 RepID=UPI003D783956
MTALERFQAWLGAFPRKRLSQDEFLGGVEQACPEISFADRRVKALEMLSVLQASGVLTFANSKAAWDSIGFPRLPRTVTVVRAASERRSFDHIVWVPDLQFAVAVTRRDLLEKLEAVNKFIIANRHRLTLCVPYRERALEIFGDEKFLDGAVSDETLWGRLPLASIGAYNPEPPLPREDFPEARGALLIVENVHTYHSLVTWNGTAKRYRSIAFGSGAAVTRAPKAVLVAVERSGSEGIQYFGDLDQEGLEIAMLLSRRLLALSGTVMAPATSLYDKLLQFGIRRSPGIEQVISDASRAWLGPELSGRVVKLFGERFWLPQEGLSLARLLADDVGSQSAKLAAM